MKVTLLALFNINRSSQDIREKVFVYPLRVILQDRIRFFGLFELNLIQ